MALTLSIGITENSYSVANNTSSVTVSVNISWTGGSWDHNGYTKYVTINGTRYNFDSVKVNPNRTTTGSQTLYSTTVTIGHNSDGRGSVSCYASVKTATGSGTVTASNSLTLTTIPRKTDVSLSASSAYFGNSITIYCAKKSSSFTNKLYYKVNSGGWNVLNANAGDSMAWTIPMSLIANIPNDMSCTITVDVDTYNGSDKIGESYAYITVNVPSSARTAPALSKTEMFLRDEAVNIALDPYAGTWQHIIAYSMGNASGYIAASMTTNKSFTFTPPIELAQQIPNAESGNLSITVYTYNGSGTLVGSTSATIKVKVPTDIKPVVSGINVSEAVSVVTDNFEGFVQNLSQLLVDISASGAQGSTISSYKTTVEGISYLGAQFTSGVIKSTGQVEIATTVTDSRGRTASGSTAITVIPYVEPSLEIAARADGTKVLVELVGSVSSVDGQNTKELTLKYKKTSDAYYSAPETILLSDWQFDIPKEINVDASETTYEFVAVLTDKIKSNEKSNTTGIVVMSRRAGGKGVTFGGEAEQDGFVCKWESQFDSGLTAGAELDMTADEIAEINTNIGTTGSRLANFLKSMALKLGLIADYVVEQGTSGIWTYRKWNSGIAECWGLWTTTSTFPNAYGGAYESASSLKKNLPSGLFIEVVPLFSGVALTSNGAWIENPRVSTTEVSTYVMNIVKQTSAINVSIYAKVTGRWK